MKVQLLNLTAQYKKIRRTALEEIKKVCDSQHYILGKNVAALEEEIAKYCGVKHAVACASGTDAILIALMAEGVKSGDKVVTTPFTFFATAGSIARIGAVPVFVDIDPMTYNIDPNALESVLKKTKGIKAIVPVHLYGQCADMTAIMALARKYRVRVIEDSAQSIGASHGGVMSGALGHSSCFSFYPTKNLGCFGDGGMMTTNDDKTAERMRMLRVHGSRARYYHDEVGMNSRLDEIQAAVLRIKLKSLEQWTVGRIKNAKLYDGLFTKASIARFITTPAVDEGNRMVYNQYVVRAKDRDALRAHLNGIGVGSEIYYPLCLHQQKCFKYLGYKKGSFPVSEKAASEVLALPIYPELKKAEISYVVESIAGFYR